VRRSFRYASVLASPSVASGGGGALGLVQGPANASIGPVYPGQGLLGRMFRKSS